MILGQALPFGGMRKIPRERVTVSHQEPYFRQLGDECLVLREIWVRSCSIYHVHSWDSCLFVLHVFHFSHLGTAPQCSGKSPFLAKPLRGRLELQPVPVQLVCFKDTAENYSPFFSVLSSTNCPQFSSVQFSRSVVSDSASP